MTYTNVTFLLGQEPFECYHISDIEAGVGVKRKHLIGVSLLVGNDHDLNGITGIGLDTAVRFVKSFSEDEILNRFVFLVLVRCVFIYKPLEMLVFTMVFGYVLRVTQVA